jgi:hypothetical protein
MQHGKLGVVAVVGCGDATKLIKRTANYSIPVLKGRTVTYKDKLKWE